MKYRMKSAEIDAIQYTGNNEQEVADFLNVPFSALHTSVDAILRSDGDYRENTHIQINTPEGTKTADCGDWIIKGEKGEFYPCKPDIFEETYEVAEDTDTTDVRERSMRVTDVHFNPADRSATIRVEGYHRMNIFDAIKAGDILYIFREGDISEIDKGFSHLWHELMEANKNLARYKQCFKDMKELMEGEE